MNFTNCQIKDRYLRISNAPVSEFIDRRRRILDYMAAHKIDVVIDVAPAVRATEIWLYGEYMSTGFAITRQGTIMVEFAQTERVDEYFLLPDGRVLEPSIYPDVTFTTHLDYPSICKNCRKVGVLHAAGHNEAFGEVSFEQKKRLCEISDTTGAEILDITQDIDTLKALHSDFEAACIFDTGEMMKQVFLAFPSILRRGKSYKEIYDETIYMLTSLGCPGEFIICDITVYDKDGHSRTLPDTVFPGMLAQEGDIVALLLETNGPSNANAAASRLFSLGKVPEAFQKAYDEAAEATLLGGSLMFPGMSLSELTDIVMRKVNSTGNQMPDYRFVHSLGYSEAEDPRANDTHPLELNTPVICHPEIYMPGREVFPSEHIRVFNTYVTSPGRGVPIFDLPLDIVIL